MKLVGFFFLGLILSLLASSEEPYRPELGSFANIEKAKLLRGELVFVDHINRRGSLRLSVDEHYQEGPLHHFAMLPYGVVRYQGSPAELKDIPLGTVLYGKFFLPPDPKTSIVPVIKGQGRPTQPPENYALLLEDDPSISLRQKKTWQIEKVEVLNGQATLFAQVSRPMDTAGLSGQHQFSVDASTRVWRGKENVTLQDLISEGVWPDQATEKANSQSIYLSFTWHPKYLYQKYHVADLWLDESAMQRAQERQRQKHIRFMHHRWIPARVTALEHDEFGKGIVTVALFGGMDRTLYEAFKPQTVGKMAAAEATLRTWWPDHDGMDGRILSVERRKDPVFGDSGIRIRFQVSLVLEGFRKNCLVRLRAEGWPTVKPPSEERVQGLKDRWPGLQIFQ